jgi:hypothetical protein
VYFALTKVEIDTVVGDDPGESLGDAPHLEDGGRLHCG